MSYRPICDTWMLARARTKYYGSYPLGFLDRARALLGVTMEPVLHVCGGRVRDYPYAGFGPYDKTLDLDMRMKPDFLRDARKRFPMPGDAPVPPPRRLAPGYWPAILIDPPYTPEDADHYKPGRDKLPSARELLLNGLNAVSTGGRVGILHYVAPRPPKKVLRVGTRPVRFVACITVFVGFENRARLYSVYELPLDGAPREEDDEAITD